MYILGRNNDDTGTQLEQLSEDILIQQGYHNIVGNRIGPGGEEIDLSADYRMPIPGGERNLRVIVECKAYRNPAAMTDWLKFLGKVFVEEVSLSEEVNGLFVALSGVNGNVAGSYTNIRHNRTRIRLLSGNELERIVCELYRAEPAVEVAARAERLTPRRHLAIELIFYERQVYWLISFENQSYTLLTSTGNFLGPERLVILRPLVEQRTANTVFVDLRDEEQARTRAEQLRRGIVVQLITSVPPLSTEQLAQLNATFNATEITEAILQLTDLGWIVNVETSVALVPLGSPGFYDTMTEIFCFVFTGTVTSDTVESVMTSQYVRTAFTHEFIEHINQIQHGLPIGTSDEETVLQIVALSPSALIYALTPDPIIVTHRIPGSDVQQFDHFDIEIFMRSLFEKLQNDFRTAALRHYFHQLCGVHEIETLQTVIVKGAHGVLFQRELFSRLGVGHVAEQHGGGYIHLIALRDAPQPWEVGTTAPSAEAL